MSQDPVQEAATALLATVKKQLTGREIAACEWAKSGEMEEELEREIRYQMRGDDDGNGYSRWDAEKLARRDCEELRVLQSLQIQFSREIGNWLDKRNAAYSRKAVRK